MEGTGRLHAHKKLPDSVAQRVRSKREAIAELMTKGYAEARRDREQKVDKLPPLSETVFSVGIKKQIRTLRAELANLAPSTRDWAPMAKEGEPMDVRLHVRGDHRNLAGEVPRGVPSLLEQTHAVSGGSGRDVLAASLVDPNNPLTARVYVNRLWQHLFGFGLVRTPNNFRSFGSETYAPAATGLLGFPAARRWLVNEVARAGDRAVAGLSTVESSKCAGGGGRSRQSFSPASKHPAIGCGGPSRCVAGPSVALCGRPCTDPASLPTCPRIRRPINRQTFPAAVHSTGAGRRTVYIKVRRNFANPLLAAFDFPDPSRSVGQREVTVGPAQSLALMNSPLVHEVIRRWVHRSEVVGAESDVGIQDLFVAALGRKPWPEEVQALESLLSGHPTEIEWRDVAHVILNHNDFLFLR